MKNKKTLLAFFISLLVGMIGGTLAYYTNTTKYTNEFQTAKYKTTTVESTTTPITLAAGGEFDKAINTTNGSWASEGNYYYYKYILEPGDTTKSLIRSIVLSKDLGSATCTTNGLEQTCVFEDGRKYELSVGVAT